MHNNNKHTKLKLWIFYYYLPIFSFTQKLFKDRRRIGQISSLRFRKLERDSFLKKWRWCAWAWASNPWPQNGRRRRNHGAMAAASKESNIFAVMYLVHLSRFNLTCTLFRQFTEQSR